MDHLNQLWMEYPEDVSNAVWLELSKVMNESKKLCPVNTGAVAEGRVTSLNQSMGQGTIKATLGYSQGYAWWVHEILENYHKPPTQAKYLEQPLDEALPKSVDSIIKRVLWLVEARAHDKARRIENGSHDGHSDPSTRRLPLARLAPPKTGAYSRTPCRLARTSAYQYSRMVEHRRICRGTGSILACRCACAGGNIG